MNNPRFSIIIPTFERAAVVPAALRSVLAQTEPDFEVLVVDDGSTDDIAAVVASFDDARVAFHGRPHAGVSATRNAGAALARGEFLVFLDSDDELLPDALARFGTAASAHGWDVVVAGRVSVAPDRRDWRTVVPRKEGLRDHQRGGFLAGAFAIRRRVFDAAGGFDERLRYNENNELGWRVRKLVVDGGATMGIVDEPAVVCFTRGDRGHDQAKYDAARQVLDEHADVLESDLAGPAAPRKRRSSYLAIAGVSAARLGRRREGLRFVGRAIRDDPTSLARYRNLGTVAHSFLRRRGDGGPAAPGRPAVTTTAPTGLAEGAVHGVVVTFNRPEKLAQVVADAAAAGLGTLTVVDNAPSPASKEAAHCAADRLPTTYVPLDENTGPAGGYAVGMARVLEHASDDDWLLTMDDDRLTGAPETVGRLRAFGTWLRERGAPVGAVGLTGAHFDARRGRLRRPPDRDLAGPLRVDYVAGGQLLMVRAAAAREVGVFDATLFFGFDDLDYCLRLARAEFGIYAYGPEWLDARRRFDRLGAVGQAPRRENPWRRYYAVRNHVVVMRRYTSWFAAVAVTLAHVFGRPVSDLVKRRGDVRALALASWRGAFDAWAGRLGRRVEPSASD